MAKKNIATVNNTGTQFSCNMNGRRRKFAFSWFLKAYSINIFTNHPISLRWSLWTHQRTRVLWNLFWVFSWIMYEMSKDILFLFFYKKLSIFSLSQNEKKIWKILMKCSECYFMKQFFVYLVDWCILFLSGLTWAYRSNLYHVEAKVSLHDFILHIFMIIGHLDAWPSKTYEYSRQIGVRRRGEWREKENHDLYISLLFKQINSWEGRSCCDSFEEMQRLMN